MDADLSIGEPEAPQVAGDPVEGEPLEALDAGGLESAEPVGVETVRALVRASGATVGYLVGDPDVEGHWRFTDEELDELCPPLTRYINRRPRLVQAVARGDEIAVAMVLAGYAGRNVAAYRDAREEREREDLEGEVEGAGGAGPEDRTDARGGDGGADEGDAYGAGAGTGVPYPAGGGMA